MSISLLFFPTHSGLLMHIAFKFHYTHENGLFSRLLNRIKSLSSFPLSLHRDGSHYTIEASGDQQELEAVAEQISLLVPRSLFLQNYSIEEIGAKSNSDDLLAEDVSYKIPYCPECQAKVTDSLNPFEPCSVCGFTETLLSMDELYAFTGLSSHTDKIFFTLLAERLIERGKLILPTFNGVRRFALLNSSQMSNEGILFCNPADISDDFVITSGELEAMMMVEKPVVRLKPKLKFRSEYELNMPFYHVLFADDKITLALSEVLKRKGVDAVYCDHLPILRVVSSLDQHMIIVAGRDMLPWRSPFALERAAFCEYNGMEAIGDTNGLQVHSTVKRGKVPFIQYVANDDHRHIENVIYFEPTHAVLRSIVLEHSLENQSLCGVYLSTKNLSQICSYSPKIGYTSMVQFSDDMLLQPKQILESIAEMDESGMRLIGNFKQNFPELYRQIEQVHFNEDTNVSMIARLWAMASVFIGLFEGDDPLKACETLEAAAIEFGGKSGPRIDYKVLSTEDGYRLDPRMAIRSAISFKLAGVDEYLLGFGFIDSLADFIAQQVENADANIGISGVTLGGSLFENRQLLMRTYNAISANYPIYKNERLGMDGANVALGAITLGSE